MVLDFKTLVLVPLLEQHPREGGKVQGIYKNTLGLTDNLPIQVSAQWFLSFVVKLLSWI